MIGPRMPYKPRSLQFTIVCASFTAVVLLCAPAASRAGMLSHHVGIATEIFGTQGPNQQIWDYEFYDLLKKNLYKDGNPVYQDLELVFNLCYGGGMIDWITGHGGLKGTWSAAAAVPARQISNQAWTMSTNPTPTGGSDGKPGDWKNPGLKLKAKTTSGNKVDQYINGYSPQYIKGIEDDPTQTVKRLHETAVQKNHRNDKAIREPGQYASSGAAADAMTIRGNADTTSQHAIAYSGGSVQSVDQHLFEKLIQVLEDAGYSGPHGSIQKLFHDGPLENPTASGVPVADWEKATKENLDKALAALRTQLLENEGKEKALIFVEGHGASFQETRTQKLKDGDPPVPGEGFTFDSLHNSLSLELDPDAQRWLEEEIPDGHGGFLEDDPLISRAGRPVLNFTTYAQSVTGPVGVYVNDVLAGLVDFTGARGDYVLPLSDAFLQNIAWLDSAPLELTVRFDFASAADSFQLSTEFDYFQDAAFSADFSHYGLGLSSALYQGAPVVPEPSGLVLLACGLLACVAGWRTRFSRRIS